VTLGLKPKASCTLGKHPELHLHFQYNRLCLFCFGHRVSLCSPGWPQTLDSPTSALSVLGLQAWPPHWAEHILLRDPIHGQPQPGAERLLSGWDRSTSFSLFTHQVLWDGCGRARKPAWRREPLEETGGESDFAYVVPG
jgi:hypothetical protein